MGDITGAYATNCNNHFEPMAGFEPATFLRFLITSQVVSTTNRHRRQTWGKDTSQFYIGASFGCR